MGKTIGELRDEGKSFDEISDIGEDQVDDEDTKDTNVRIESDDPEDNDRGISRPRSSGGGGGGSSSRSSRSSRDRNRSSQKTEVFVVSDAPEDSSKELAKKFGVSEEKVFTGSNAQKNFQERNKDGKLKQKNLSQGQRNQVEQVKQRSRREQVLSSRQKKQKTQGTSQKKKQEIATFLDQARQNNLNRQGERSGDSRGPSPVFTPETGGFSTSPRFSDTDTQGPQFSDTSKDKKKPFSDFVNFQNGQLDQGNRDNTGNLGSINSGGNNNINANVRRTTTSNSGVTGNLRDTGNNNRVESKEKQGLTAAGVGSAALNFLQQPFRGAQKSVASATPSNVGRVFGLSDSNLQTIQQQSSQATEGINQRITNTLREGNQNLQGARRQAGKLSEAATGISPSEARKGVKTLQEEGFVASDLPKNLRETTKDRDVRNFALTAGTAAGGTALRASSTLGRRAVDSAGALFAGAQGVRAARNPTDENVAAAILSAPAAAPGVGRAALKGSAKTAEKVKFRNAKEVPKSEAFGKKTTSSSTDEALRQFSEADNRVQTVSPDRIKGTFREELAGKPTAGQGKKGSVGLEDPGIFVAPKGRGQTQFLRQSGEGTGTPTLNPKKLAQSARDEFRTPSVTEFKVNKVTKQPKSVTNEPGFLKSADFIRNQRNKGNVVITKRSQIGKGEVGKSEIEATRNFRLPQKALKVRRDGKDVRLQEGDLVRKGDVFKTAGTTETEAVIPPGSNLRIPKKIDRFVNVNGRKVAVREGQLLDDFGNPAGAAPRRPARTRSSSIDRSRSQSVNRQRSQAVNRERSSSVRQQRQPTASEILSPKKVRKESEALSSVFGSGKKPVAPSGPAFFGGTGSGRSQNQGRNPFSGPSSPSGLKSPFSGPSSVTRGSSGFSPGRPSGGSSGPGTGSPGKPSPGFSFTGSPTGGRVGPPGGPGGSSSGGGSSIFGGSGKKPPKGRVLRPQSQKPKRQPGFVATVRQDGKSIQLNKTPLPRNRAANLAGNVIDNSIATQGSIKRQGRTNVADSLGFKFASKINLSNQGRKGAKLTERFGSFNDTPGEKKKRKPSSFGGFFKK